MGTGVVGWERYTNYSFPMGQPTVQTEQKQGWSSGFFLGSMAGIGGLIPLNERMDLLIRPDVGANFYFYSDDGLIYLYGRLCIGIHLKSKSRIEVFIP